MRRSRPAAHFHVTRGTPESHDAHVNAEIYSLSSSRRSLSVTAVTGNRLRP
jgi:hypothetical protein